MNMIVRGRHMEVRPDIREYAEEKVGKVARILNGQVMSIEVELYHERNRSIEKHQVAEVTIKTKGHVIRAREGSPDMKAAIDLVSDKLETQARKLKSKTVDRRTGKLSPAPVPAAAGDDEEEATEPSIVKMKRVDLKPMSHEEAILQLELLGHDFFLFSDVDEMAVNVLYRRRDGDYGLIQPRS
ncbi:MAG: ribosome-associated translation inhibitor RaiA [Coriobacteriia bacterium]|nr:ribosome-associated translation inhibitor RaiA [Coriobacteriia bacterium]